jgi:hypothetical protein
MGVESTTSSDLGQLNSTTMYILHSVVLREQLETRGGGLSGSDGGVGELSGIYRDRRIEVGLSGCAGALVGMRI